MECKLIQESMDFGKLSESRAAPKPTFPFLTPSIYSVAYNQDNSWFAVGTTAGFRIYETATMRLLYYRENHEFSLNTGVVLVSLYYRTQIVAFVTDGRNEAYGKNTVLIWDDYQRKVVGSHVVEKRVMGLHFAREKLLIIDGDYIRIVELRSMRTLQKIKQGPMRSQMLAPFSVTKGDKPIIVYCGDKMGCVNVRNINTDSEKSIQAFTDDLIQMIATSSDGSYIACVNSTGTLLKIFDTKKGEMLSVFKRGSFEAEVTFISFSPDSKLIGMVSNRGTLHVFTVQTKKSENFLKSMYYERSFLKFKFDIQDALCAPEKCTFKACVFTFEDNQKLKLLSPAGYYYYVDFKENTQEGVVIRPDNDVWFDPYSVPVIISDPTVPRGSSQRGDETDVIVSKEEENWIIISTRGGNANNGVSRQSSSSGTHKFKMPIAMSSPNEFSFGMNIQSYQEQQHQHIMIIKITTGDLAKTILTEQWFSSRGIHATCTHARTHAHSTNTHKQ
eukprot:TRINITY_DN2435_c0_g1_i5.p1 TRINITY_DN2435_c0_g1~~TRINITY_DN2435_c0_g1_i5.p1  ORF type:complete len:501 (-),score=46.39 TRINITY_DN2435_c0_g1_i5:1172-2674(-)